METDDNADKTTMCSDKINADDVIPEIVSIVDKSIVDFNFRTVILRAGNGSSLCGKTADDVIPTCETETDAEINQFYSDESIQSIRNMTPEELVSTN